jgi:hypothetical protein
MRNNTDSDSDPDWEKMNRRRRPAIGGIELLEYLGSDALMSSIKQR